jgi:uncharacterized protein with von Willebrand factor type A (vWA) domain
MEPALIKFSRFLVANGVPVSTAELLDGVRACRLVGPRSRGDFMNALRAAFTHRREDFAVFERLFDQYFNEYAPVDEDEDQAPGDRPNSGLGLEAAQSTDDEPPSQADMASALEVLGRTGFSRLNPAQAAMMAAEVQTLLQPLGLRLSRRRRPGGRRELAWGPTLRRSLRAGGEVLDLRFNKRRQRSRRLVVLADVSGSMDISTPYIFHFLKGLAGVWRQVELFVFATRLTRATAWLARSEVRTFMRRLPNLVPDLAGGTRMGPALSALFRIHGRRLGPSTVALLVSDGWDRGDPAQLKREMARLHKRCHRVIWLNPLLESPRYEPINRGMAAALPYIDHFLGCHNLNSLKKTADLLTKLIK